MGNCLAKSGQVRNETGFSGMTESHGNRNHTKEVKLQGEIRSRNVVIAVQEARIEELQDKNTELSKRLNGELKSKDEVIAGQAARIKDLEDKNNELLTRVSALASAKLTDGNANIADLSDENRPTKLAEQFSELYDNEWTDAFEKLTRLNRRSDEEACTTLLKILLVTYRQCIVKAQNENENLVKGMEPFCKEQEIPRDILKHFKDTRKKKKPGELEDIENEMKEYIKDILPNKKERRSQKMKHFVKKSRTLCWYMAVQDPPVYMDTNINRTDEHYNSNTHKPYTQSGIYVAFIVWPALYLCQEGNLLSKGVVQCKNSCENWQHAKEIETTSQVELQDQPIIEHINTANRSKDHCTNKWFEEAIKNDRSCPSPRPDKNMTVTRLSTIYTEPSRNISDITCEN